MSYNFTWGKLSYLEASLFGRIKPNQVTRIRNLSDSNSFIIRESTFRFFLGTKHLRFFASISSFNPSQDFGDLGVIESNLNFGIFVEIDEFFKKKKKKKKKKK